MAKRKFGPKQIADQLRTELDLLEQERRLLRTLTRRSRSGTEHVIYLAVRTSHLIRLSRILDRDPRTPSIWTLLDADGSKVRAAFARHGVDETALCDLTSRVKPLRDMLFAHKNMRALAKRDEVYTRANLKGSEIDELATALRRIITAAYP